tara:strand:+ start:468 stop:695 length:228 start_codon:yes stop_codon:yes gene_type:complete
MVDVNKVNDILGMTGGGDDKNIQKRILSRFTISWLRNLAIRYKIKIVKKVKNRDKFLNKTELINKLIKHKIKNIN